MSCSRAQHGAVCGNRTQELSIWSPMLYHYATALPQKNLKLYSHIKMSYIPDSIPTVSLLSAALSVYLSAVISEMR